jgi:cytochrome c5
MRRHLSILFVWMLLAAACSKKAAPPPAPQPAAVVREAAPAPKPQLADGSLAAGQTLFNQKCGRCHALRKPEEFTARQWRGIMEIMGPRAKLDDAQKMQVLAFLKSKARVE